MDAETILQGLGTLLKEAEDRVTLIQATIDTVSGKIAPQLSSLEELQKIQTASITTP